MDKYISDLNITCFNEEPFSQRDAFRWMITNSNDGNLSYSIRHMAGIWKWHYSRVKRFLERIKSEVLIKTAIKSGKLHMTICNYDSFIMPVTKPTPIPIPAKIKIFPSPDTISKQDRNSKIKSDRELHENSETISTQDQNNISDTKQDRNNNRNSESLHYPNPEKNSDTISTQDQNSDIWQEEKKKKRTKKRKKEEFIKERNIPYGDTKKENLVENLQENSEFLGHLKTLTYSQGNHQRDRDSEFAQDKAETQLFRKKQVPIHMVEVCDVEEWAEKTLPFEIDLTWELGKFQDYWNTAHKKPPKDGVAALRNWLRKAVEIEIKNKGDRNDRHNNTRGKERTSDFERFIEGGARALDELHRDRLDGKEVWQES